MREWMLAALLTLGNAATLAAQSEPLLQLQGQPYFGGSMTLHLSGSVGQPALIAYGLNPLLLALPVQTGKGPWYIGSLVNLVPVGNIPSDGRIDLPFTMPPNTPALAGIPIVMQGYVPFALSNPATLPLDEPYYVPAAATILQSPNPTEIGSFGAASAVGDLNGDGVADVVIGAWFEDSAGVDRSGRAYVFWGPALDLVTTLEPPDPKVFGEFGKGLAVADLDSDGVDDLVVGEGTGSPAPPQQPGTLYLYKGGSPFIANRFTTILSEGTGTEYQSFGGILATGDFNDDGFLDIAVGLPNLDQGISNVGRIEVYWGPGFANFSTIFSPNPGQDDFFGTDLAAADLNGDGITDLIESSSRDDVQGVVNVGSIHLFTGPSLSFFKTIDNPLPDGFNSRFGDAVFGLDLNGDGMDDIITTDERNHAYVFWSPSFADYHLISRPPDPITGSTAVSASFGYFVTAGDVNDDGWNDVVVAEPFALSSQGRVDVSLGPYYATFNWLQDKIPEAHSEFGWGLLLRDMDGDGRPELLVGSDGATVAGLKSAGRLTIFDLSP